MNYIIMRKLFTLTLNIFFDKGKVRSTAGIRLPGERVRRPACGIINYHASAILQLELCSSKYVVGMVL